MKRKTLLMALLCLFSVIAMAQDVEVSNCHLKDGRVYWQKVFEHEPSDSTLIKNWFLGTFEVTNTDNGRISCKAENVSLPWTQAGYNVLNVVLAFRDRFTLYFDVDFKDGRYRVTVNDAHYFSEASGTSYAHSLFDVNLKNGELPRLFVKNTAPQADAIFSIYFTDWKRTASSNTPDEEW